MKQQIPRSIALIESKLTITPPVSINMHWPILQQLSVCAWIGNIYVHNKINNTYYLFSVEADESKQINI